MNNLTSPISWVGPVYDPSGYAAEVREMTMALARQGVTPTLRAAANHSAAFRSTLSEVEKDQLDRLLAQSYSPDGITVTHLPPQYLEPITASRYNVGRTMFETTGLSPEAVRRCNAMDELWIPSNFNIETFRQAGVRTRMFPIAGGIDTTRFHPDNPPLGIPDARSTVFLSINVWRMGKGWKQLVRAWATAFSAQDDVSLVFRSYVPGTTETDSGPLINRDIDDYLLSLGMRRSDIAPIIVLGKQIPLEDLPRLYTSAQVYVTPSRGEGWGYPFMEAMASGLITIGTRWSGNLMFMNDSNSLLCDVKRLIPVGDHYVAGDEIQQWALPSWEHLAQLLRRPVDSPEVCRGLVQQAIGDMRTLWTWERTAEQCLERFEEIARKLRVRYRRSEVTRGPIRADDAQLVVRWEGPFFTQSSLGLVNREVGTRLIADHEVELVPRPSQTADLIETDLVSWRELATRLSRPASGPADVHISHRWPPLLDPPHEGAWVLMQPWEYGGLPGEWVPIIRDQVDEYWVYSTWQRECAILSGIPAERIQVIPLGVDAARYRPEGRQLALRTKKRFKFLAVGGIIPRKGMELLVSAYLDTFTPDDDVCLVIKGLSSRWAYSDNPSQSDFALLPELARKEGRAEIEFLGETMSENDMPALYRACDALVAPFRGEGFCLPIVEAMATGLPVIVTETGPALDICDETLACLVPASPREVSKAITGLEPGALGFWWAEPDAVALGSCMREVSSNQALAQRLGRSGRNRVLESFTWEHTANAVRRRIRELATGRPPAPDRMSEIRPYQLSSPRSLVVLYRPRWHGNRWQATINSYLRQISADDDVTLAILLDPDQGMDQQFVLDSIREIQDQLGILGGNAPDLLLIPDRLTSEILTAVYRAAQVLLIDEPLSPRERWELSPHFDLVLRVDDVDQLASGLRAGA
jgi:glycosyltransferase involved in cell wall biosynthesis